MPSGLWYVWETLDTRFKASGVGVAPLPSGLWYVWETLDTRFQASGVGAAPIAEWSRVRVGNTGHTLPGIGCGGGPNC